MNTEQIEVAGLSVELVRKPIKNLHIGVYPPAGRVRVAAPPAISEDAIRVAIVTRLGWIKNKQRQFAEQAREPERLYVSGETHYYFGRPLRLGVRQAPVRAGQICVDSADRISMVVPRDASRQDKTRWMSAWYRRELRDKAAPRVSKWAARLDVAEPAWGIRAMHTKWGSCNPDTGRLWVNLDLVKKPLVCLDYVILHEMAHFVSRRHDDVFVAVLDRHMPGWRQIRADLNKLPLSAPVGSQRTRDRGSEI